MGQRKSERSLRRSVQCALQPYDSTIGTSQPHGGRKHHHVVQRHAERTSVGLNDVPGVQAVIEQSNRVRGLGKFEVNRNSPVGSCLSTRGGPTIYAFGTERQMATERYTPGSHKLAKVRRCGSIISASSPDNAHETPPETKTQVIAPPPAAYPSGKLCTHRCSATWIPTNAGRRRLRWVQSQSGLLAEVNCLARTVPPE